MGIIIRNNIVNQKGNPAWYEDTLANRPTANLQGRMFVDTNNPSTGIYRDTGSSWVAVADPGVGTTGTLQQVTTNGSTTNVGISITTLTTGSVLFSGTGGLISQDNTNLFWDDANNFLGIGPTGGPTALLDIHSATQNVFIQVNATSTNNSQVAFLNGGVGKWRIGNLYNAGTNDFIIFDTTNTLSRLTIKNTGQTFIGTDTTSSGLFVVNSASSDNHIVVLGANAPSIRLRNTGAGTPPTLNVGLGISTATNNFIQGSVSGDFCIFNTSTTPSPITFGIYDAGTSFTQEAARISAARNLLVGTTTDSGYKLSVSGTANITGALSGTSATFSGNVGIGGDNAVVRLNVIGAGATSATFGLNILNSATTPLCQIRNDGQFRVGSAANSPYNYTVVGRALFVDSDGFLGYVASVRESKTNINSLSDISWLYKLNAVSFNYRKKDDDNIYTDEAQEDTYYGLIADEVEKVNKNLVFYNTKEDGTKTLAGVEYNKLISALIKSVQYLKAEIDELKAK